MRIESDSGFREQIAESLFGIRSIGYESGDARVNEHLGTQDTWRVSAVYGGALDADTMQRCLHYDVLLGMDGTAYLVAGPRRNTKFVTKTAELQTVLHPGRCAVVAC